MIKSQNQAHLSSLLVQLCSVVNFFWMTGDDDDEDCISVGCVNN